MSCTYLTNDRCELCSLDCKYEHTCESCSFYNDEQRRLRAVTKNCKFASRRTGYNAKGHKRDREKVVWCHAVIPAQLCYAWPDDCPVRLLLMLKDYQLLLKRARLRIKNCSHCNAAFITGEAREQIYCSKQCKVRAGNARARRKWGIQPRQRRTDRKYSSRPGRHASLRWREYRKVAEEQRLREAGNICACCLHHRQLTVCVQGKTILGAWSWCSYRQQKVHKWDRHTDCFQVEGKYATATIE